MPLKLIAIFNSWTNVWNILCIRVRMFRTAQNTKGRKYKNEVLNQIKMPDSQVVTAGFSVTGNVLS